MANGITEPVLYRNVSEDESISQGDLLFDFPIVMPDVLSFEGMQKVTKENIATSIRMKIFEADIIVLSQSCDLVKTDKRDPVDPVICAAIYDIGNYEWKDIAETNSGRRPSYFLLNKEEDFLSKSYLIDFGSIFTISYDLLNKFSSTSGNRIRPVSPILEKISQQFGNYFSRIGTEYERAKPDLKSEHDTLYRGQKS